MPTAGRPFPDFEPDGTADGFHSHLKTPWCSTTYFHE